ncbi:MAG: radical SAM protein [Spirochaetaceae bacterium]|jgi:hypothetical protein|nr:radical SAM protein [Spirochaetaceae bacterium]
MQTAQNKTSVFLIQAPFVQLNTPYPSIYYLKSFLSKHGFNATIEDHSITLFENIFCSAGLKKIFQLVKDSKRKYPAHIVKIVNRFLSEEQLWINCIDRIVEFLRGKNREDAFFLTLANGTLPSGPRTAAFIESCTVSQDNAFLLATKMLGDISDFITETLDSNFGLVRYVNNISKSSGGQNSNYACIMQEFYKPFLHNCFFEKIRSSLSCGKNVFAGITIPFQGCLASAIVLATEIKTIFADSVTVIAGGAYLNTEFQGLDAKKYFTCFDHVVLNQGYDDLLNIISGTNFTAQDNTGDIFPDYCDVDFSRYLYPLDALNPMHRLWSDGHWLKAYLAYGCYWHSCIFCDTELDYIKRYTPCNVEKLFYHLKKQSEITGIKGIHFVDEAMPQKLLTKFALLNIQEGSPLVFWGNIRFEKTWTSDVAAILAKGGLIGVSGGIEIASEQGLKKLCKGISLEDIVFSLAAFKEAGILTHAYLIFGYYDQDEQDIINSAENVRQLFSEGLLDSAFWHQFILTKNSRLYMQYKNGKHPLLILDSNTNEMPLGDLSFKGESKFEKYSAPLDNLLGEWMRGNTNASVKEAFPFSVKPVTQNNIAGLINKYALSRDNAKKIAPQNEENIFFAGSLPLLQETKNTISLFWRFRLQDHELSLKDKNTAQKLQEYLNEISKANNSQNTPALFYEKVHTLFENEAANVTDFEDNIWQHLRSSGVLLF